MNSTRHFFWQMNTEVECYSPGHTKYLIVALPVILLLVVGFPVYLLFSIRNHKVPALVSKQLAQERLRCIFLYFSAFFAAVEIQMNYLLSEEELGVLDRFSFVVKGEQFFYFKLYCPESCCVDYIFRCIDCRLSAPVLVLGDCYFVQESRIDADYGLSIPRRNYPSGMRPGHHIPVPTAARSVSTVRFSATQHRGNSVWMRVNPHSAARHPPFGHCGYNRFRGRPKDARCSEHRHLVCHCDISFGFSHRFHSEHFPSRKVGPEAASQAPLLQVAQRAGQERSEGNRPLECVLHNGRCRSQACCFLQELDEQQAGGGIQHQWIGHYV